ncbi:MAG: hypothetical protein AB7O73_09255 [Bacteroidia bacterium]
MSNDKRFQRLVLNTNLSNVKNNGVTSLSPTYSSRPSDTDTYHQYGWDFVPIIHGGGIWLPHMVADDCAEDVYVFNNSSIF